MLAEGVTASKNPRDLIFVVVVVETDWTGYFHGVLELLSCQLNGRKVLGRVETRMSILIDAEWQLTFSIIIINLN